MVGQKPRATIMLGRVPTSLACDCYAAMKRCRRCQTKNSDTCGVVTGNIISEGAVFQRIISAQYCQEGQASINAEIMNLSVVYTKYKSG